MQNVSESQNLSVNLRLSLKSLLERSHLEMIDKLLHGHVALDSEAVPERPLGSGSASENRLGSAVILGRSGDGFGKGEEGQSQVHETVFVRLDLLVT